jgi:hypothetical protein
MHAAHDRPRRLRHIDRLEASIAVAARAALRLRVHVLAEVPQQIAAQTVAGRAVADHPLKPLALARAHAFDLFGRQLLVLRVLVDEEALGLEVAVVPQEQALRQLAVATGAARLLVVRLHRTGHVEVDDVAHVRFVDTHAERVRCHHDGGVVVDERPLIGRALLGREPRMVAHGLDAGIDQRRADLLGVLLRVAQ